MGGGFWTLALLAVIVLIYLDSKRKSKKADTTINSNEDEIEDKPSLKEKLTDASIAFANELKDKVKNSAKVTKAKESLTEKGKSEKVQLKEWWSEKTKKQKIWIVVGCLFFIGLINNLGGGSESKSSNNSATENGNCSQSGDERYIENKMDQQNRDVIDIKRTGDRKYYVRYIDWSRGSGREGDVVLDYSSAPCHD